MLIRQYVYFARETVQPALPAHGNAVDDLGDILRNVFALRQSQGMCQHLRRHNMSPDAIGISARFVTCDADPRCYLFVFAHLSFRVAASLFNCILTDKVAASNQLRLAKKKLQENFGAFHEHNSTKL